MGRLSGQVTYLMTAQQHGAGLMLRAESMDEKQWWWAVSDILSDEVIIDSTNNYNTRFVGGENARRKAVQIAKDYLNVD